MRSQLTTVHHLNVLMLQVPYSSIIIIWSTIIDFEIKYITVLHWTLLRGKYISYRAHNEVVRMIYVDLIDQYEYKIIVNTTR